MVSTHTANRFPVSPPKGREPSVPAPAFSAWSETPSSSPLPQRNRRGRCARFALVVRRVIIIIIIIIKRMLILIILIILIAIIIMIIIIINNTNNNNALTTTYY